jgi:hypothetical protein
VLLVAAYWRTNLTMRPDRSAVRRVARRRAPGHRHPRTAVGPGPSPPAPGRPDRDRRRHVDPYPGLPTGRPEQELPLLTNPQLAIDASTRLVIALGDPQPGNRNDTIVYRTSGIAPTGDRPVMADGGYQGNHEVITPYRKPRDGSPLPAWKHDLNA